MSTEVRIPEALWQTVLGLFAEHPPGVERVAFLDGFRIDESGYPEAALGNQVFVATTVVVPDAILKPGSYVVSADAISAAGRHLRIDRMTRVAQVHSHGNGAVDHSPTDDDHAYSQRSGAISIVVPFHGSTRADISDCGVHIRADEGWWRVSSDVVIKVIPSVLDHRSSNWLPTQHSAPHGGISSRFRAWVRRVWTSLVHSGSSST